jgi:hypothetical protein
VKLEISLGWIEGCATLLTTSKLHCMCSEHGRHPPVATGGNAEGHERYAAKHWLLFTPCCLKWQALASVHALMRFCFFVCSMPASALL